MSNLSRRKLLVASGPLCAALAAPAAANAQLVYGRGDWKVKEFQELLDSPARIRQMFDVTAVNDGKFLNNIKNSLNGFEFGFGIAPKQVRIIAALHGAANMINYDDIMWAKYRIGEWLSVADPQTGKPAVRNIFFPRQAAEARGKEDPSNEKSTFQDKSVEALQQRGVKFLSCHTATEEQAKVLVARLKLAEAPESVVKDMQAHTVPNVLIVPSMVAAVAILQIEGHYSYVTV